jgi:SPP1 gp7 family putative phage head morphogenesis protein
VKKEMIARISPWFTKEGAAARAELLMQHHAFAAYSACQARIMDRMKDVFPFRQYLSTEDNKVRASHRALNGIILPADHSFWRYHTPPWEWNCRCQVVELTAEDKDEEEKLDAKRLPEKQRVLKGAALNQLNTGSLNRGPSVNVDVRTPKERGGNYQWSASDAGLPYAEIRKRWEAPVAEMFEAWAAKTLLDLGTNLLQWLLGKTKLMGGN